MILHELVEKYRNGMISTAELKDSFFRSLYEKPLHSTPTKRKASEAANSFERLFLWLSEVAAVSRLQLSESLFCFMLIGRLSLVALAQFYSKLLLIYPFQYLDFFFTFRLKYSRLRAFKDKKNVLCIISTMVMGGAERTILNIAKGIDKEKYLFHVITTSTARNVWARDFEIYFQNVFSPRVRRTRYLYDYDTIYRKYFNFLIKKLNIDVVLISHSAVGYSCLPRLVSSFPRLKSIDVLHVKNWPPEQLREGVAPYVDRRICISQNLREYLLGKYREFGLNDKYNARSRVIYNGVDTSEYSSDVVTKGRFRTRFSIPGNAKIVSFIGRFSDEKNPCLFVEVANEITGKFPGELRFVMAGEGAELEKVRNAINKNNLEERFVLAGLTDNVVELLNDTYLLLVVSRTEGIPFVVLEAMSMGVPVLSTDVGGVREVIENGVNGFLIDVENDVVESFTRRILDLLEGKADYYGMSEKARKTVVARFTSDSMSSKYQATLDELTHHDLRLK